MSKTEKTTPPIVGEVEAPAPKKEPAPKSAGFSCYIGPTIPGVIQSGSVIPSTRAKALRQLSGTIDRYPLVAVLVVDGLTLPYDRAKVKTPGNRLYEAYRKLATGQIE